MIQIIINDIDEAQVDVFRSTITAAQDITCNTHYDVEIIYDGETIVETYIDWVSEYRRYDVITSYKHPRFTKYLEDDEV